MANLDVGRLRVLIADGNEHTIGIIRSMLRGSWIQYRRGASDFEAHASGEQFPFRADAVE